MKLEIKRTSNQVSISASTESLISLVTNAKAFCEEMTECMPDLIEAEKDNNAKASLSRVHRMYAERFKIYERILIQLESKESDNSFETYTSL